MNEGPEFDPKLDGRAPRFGLFRWIPLIVAILIMIAFAMFAVIGRQTTRPGHLPGTPQQAPESHFNPLDPSPNRNPDAPRVLHVTWRHSANIERHNSSPPAFAHQMFGCISLFQHYPSRDKDI